MNLPATDIKPDLQEQGVQQEPFLQHSSPSKQAIARRFGDAAKVYDKKALVQKQVSKVGLELLRQRVIQPALKTSATEPSRLHYGIDIGCGTGLDTHHLLELADQVIGADLSPGMIDWAREHHRKTGLSWLVADAEDLPVDSNQQDIVFSSMALQWLSDTQPVAQECFRIMAKGGQGVVAVVLKDSLFELYQSWLSLTENPPVNDFFCANKWLSSFENAGFACRMECRDFTTYHADVFDVLHSIKDVGAGVVLTGGKPGLLKKTNLKLLNQRYKSVYAIQEQSPEAHSKVLPLTWKIGFLQFEK